MSKNWYKSPTLYEAFDLYCQRWCDELPTDEELADITFSPSFEARMRVLLRRQKYGYYVLFGTAWRSVASVLVAILVSMSIATFSVRALREPVLRFITEVFETFTNVLFVDDEPASAQVEMEFVDPEYIPQGYVVENELKTQIMNRIEYRNPDTDGRYVYTQSWENTGAMGINTENIEHHTVKVWDFDGISYVQNDSTVVMFAYGKYTFTLKGILSEDELLKIALSIPLE